jgi:GH25 family lysozyme M1 (1,4-beta-N-acetylmuramidase)
MKPLTLILVILLLIKLYNNKEYKVIDVSSYQGKIDWKKVKESGIEGAIIRCGFGIDSISQDDPYFENNVQGCIENNIPFGAYLYSYADSVEKAKSEARHTIRLVSKYKSKLDLPIFYYLEQENLGQYAVENGKAFIDLMENYGYNVGIYANQNMIDEYIKNNFNDYPLWIARYGINDGEKHEEPEIPHGVQEEMWQYTDNYQVDGIDGSVGMNVYHKEIITVSNADLFGKLNLVIVNHQLCQW